MAVAGRLVAALAGEDADMLATAASDGERFFGFLFRPATRAIQWFARKLQQRKARHAALSHAVRKTGTAGACDSPMW